MTIEKPIFIVGTGRSGSTAFHNIFSAHPNMAWMSRLCDAYPNKPSINRFLMQAIDFPMVGRYLKRKLLPSECYPFWEYYYKGFSAPCRDLLPQDVTTKAKARFQKVFAEMLTSRRNRLLVKITGWSRIGFLHEIFNDAKFIHIVRDTRAVVNSAINVDWYRASTGPQVWGLAELTPSQKKEWSRHNQSFLALGGIHVKIMVDAVEKAKEFVGKDDFMEIKYEDLCAAPLRVFSDVLRFCELETSKEFEDSVTAYPLKNTNSKWRNELTLEQQNIVEDVVRDCLKRYGYL